MGGTSKFIATSVTYPYQVTKARIQQRNSAYRGFVHCVTETLRHEGWRGFFKGFVANVIRVAPASAVTIAAYEAIRPLARDLFPASNPEE